MPRHITLPFSVYLAASGGVMDHRQILGIAILRLQVKPFAWPLDQILMITDGSILHER
ncbi:MAG: hypothetical protein JWR19_3907 [Pedosphaera sp.]|jgi:hypothetical protein|nr:hypothetical protein [Pedosphaera sp.]